MTPHEGGMNGKDSLWTKICPRTMTIIMRITVNDDKTSTLVISLFLYLFSDCIL